MQTLTFDKTYIYVYGVAVSNVSVVTRSKNPRLQHRFRAGIGSRELLTLEGDVKVWWSEEFDYMRIKCVKCKRAMGVRTTVFLDHCLKCS